MTIAVGEKIPETTFKTMTEAGAKNMPASEVFGGKKVVLFAVPGAFTPTCHLQHMPGFVKHYDAFKSKGVDTVACTGVNDVFVFGSWAKSSGADDRILFLADGNGDFAKAMGLDIDLSVASLGVRSKRYALYAEDGVIKALLVEDSPGSAEQSSAEALLAAI
ncbi:MAG: peroxiredoxin [Hyphomicrobiales bacterium]|nr:peroxiredoxin [Hyphomicrobiales bacterium]